MLVLTSNIARVAPMHTILQNIYLRLIVVCFSTLYLMQTPYMDISCGPDFKDNDDQTVSAKQEQTASTQQAQKPMTKKEKRKQQRAKKQEDLKKKKQLMKEIKGPLSAAGVLKKIVIGFLTALGIVALIKCIAKCCESICKCNSCRSICCCMNSDQYETCLVVAKQHAYKVACANMARQIMKNNTAGRTYQSIETLAESGMKNTWHEWVKTLKQKIGSDKLKNLRDNVTLTTQSISSASIVIADYLDKELKNDGAQTKEKYSIRERAEFKIGLYGVASLSVSRDTKDCVCCSTPNQELEDECNTLSSLLDKLNYFSSWKSDAYHPKCCGTCCGIQCFNRMMCCCNTSCCCITKAGLYQDISNIINGKLSCTRVCLVEDHVSSCTTRSNDTVMYDNPDGYNSSTIGSHNNLGGNNGPLQSSSYNIHNVI